MMGKEYGAKYNVIVGFFRFYKEGFIKNTLQIAAISAWLRKVLKISLGKDIYRHGAHPYLQLAM